MKTGKILTLIISFVLIGCFQITQAQTIHKELYATIDNEYVFCLNKQLTGSWTYHISYQVDKKTGFLKKLHWNVKSDLWDENGNTYKIIDTGNDSMGYFWDLFNNINAYNEGFDITYYDVEDGWLPTGIAPQEGMFMNNFKFIGNGEKFYWKVMMQARLDANGELQIEVLNENIDCNE